MDQRTDLRTAASYGDKQYLGGNGNQMTILILLKYEVIGHYNCHVCMSVCVSMFFVCIYNARQSSWPRGLKDKKNIVTLSKQNKVESPSVSICHFLNHFNFYLWGPTMFGQSMHLIYTEMGKFGTLQMGPQVINIF